MLPQPGRRRSYHLRGWWGGRFRPQKGLIHLKPTAKQGLTIQPDALPPECQALRADVNGSM